MLDGFSAVTYALCKKYTNGAIQNVVESFSEGMHFQGSVPTRDDLPENPQKGDLYIIREDGVKVVYDGNEWVEFDSDYYTKSEVDAKLRDLERQIPSTDDLAKKADLLSEINRAKSREDEIQAAIPTKTSQLRNDSHFLTRHQDISGKADISYVDAQLELKQDKLTAGPGITIEDNVISSTGGVGTVKSVNNIGPDANGNVTLDIPDVSDFYTKAEVDAELATKQDQLSVDDSLVLDNGSLSAKISSHDKNGLELYKSPEFVSQSVIPPTGQQALVTVDGVDMNVLEASIEDIVPPLHPLTNPIQIEHLGNGWYYKDGQEYFLIPSLEDAGVAWHHTSDAEDELAGTIIQINWQEKEDAESGLYVRVPSKVSELSNDTGYLTQSSLDNYYTKDEAFSQDEVETLLVTKQDALTAGQNITIRNNVISATITDTIGRNFVTNVTVGNLPSGTQINSSDTVADILYRILYGTGPIEMVDIYYGSVDNIPNDLTGLTRIQMNSNEVVGRHTQHMVSGNVELEEGQYPVYAVPRGYVVTKWISNGFDYNISHTHVMTSEYNIYYLDMPSYDEPDGIDYVITIEEE